MLTRLGRWVVLGVVLAVVTGCQSWSSASAVYFYEPSRLPTPSYNSRDQRFRASDYYDFYNRGGYECGHC